MYLKRDLSNRPKEIHVYDIVIQKKTYERNACIWKETYVSEKRPMYLKKVLSNRPKESRVLNMFYEKRPIKETHVYEKRPMYLKRDLSNRSKEIRVCEIVLLVFPADLGLYIWKETY